MRNIASKQVRIKNGRRGVLKFGLRDYFVKKACGEKRGSVGQHKKIAARETRK